MLKKLPCPDNLKLIPYIRQQLSLDELCGCFLFGALVEKGASRQLITC